MNVILLITEYEGREYIACASFITNRSLPFFFFFFLNFTNIFVCSVILQTYPNPLRSNPAYSVVKWVKSLLTFQVDICFFLLSSPCDFEWNWLNSTISICPLHFQAVLCSCGWYCAPEGAFCFSTSSFLDRTTSSQIGVSKILRINLTLM